jgi:zinc transport system substrate-binding protein
MPRALFLVVLMVSPPALAAPRLVATIHPLVTILRPVIGPGGEVARLVPPGASPHTFEPRPSDVRAVEGAAALIVVSPDLDGWAWWLPAARRLEASAWVPPAMRLPQLEAGGTSAVDPHFWTDPLTVAAALSGLVAHLCEIDAGGCASYGVRAARFSGRLARLQRKLERLLAPVRGRSVLLFHPSFQYMLRRYGLLLAGVIEPFPGKEPPPRYLADIVGRLRTSDAAIFSEPQLPSRPAEVVAEAAGRPVGVLDPNGGVAGRETYAELMVFNARALRAALR